MKPALAIFAKTPLPGLVKTRLVPPLSPELSAELYRCMMVDTVNRVRSLAVDTFIFYHGEAGFFAETFPGLPLIPQSGDCLGQRLEHAFSTLASLGYAARVTIGTDAPDFPLCYLRQAFEALDASDVVFGPAEDGGYYLVGVRSGHGGLFREIPWSSCEVLEKSLEKAAQEGLGAALLPRWYDVDSIEELRRPGLRDPLNEAPLTRKFLSKLDIAAFQPPALPSPSV